jgi:hypothetical protein
MNNEFASVPRQKPNSNLLSLMAMVLLALCFTIAAPAQKAMAQPSDRYSIQEVIDAGHGFFQSTSGHIASAIERVYAERGQPNGYILGEEASGAFIGGLRYGEGVLYTKNAGDHKLYWQGPSIGWDYGADGNRTMMLVYNLPSVNKVYRRYYGVSGSAFLVGGVGVTVLTNKGVHLVPIRTRIGARLGVNVGYLKFSSSPRINPF